MAELWKHCGTYPCVVHTACVGPRELAVGSVQSFKSRETLLTTDAFKLTAFFLFFIVVDFVPFKIFRLEQNGCTCRSAAEMASQALNCEVAQMGCATAPVQMPTCWAYMRGKCACVYIF
jgi:hypothetical protein